MSNRVVDHKIRQVSLTELVEQNIEYYYSGAYLK